MLIKRNRIRNVRPEKLSLVLWPCWTCGTSSSVKLNIKYKIEAIKGDSAEHYITGCPFPLDSVADWKGRDLNYILLRHHQRFIDPDWLTRWLCTLQLCSLYSFSWCPSSSASTDHKFRRRRTVLWYHIKRFLFTFNTPNRGTSGAGGGWLGAILK